MFELLWSKIPSFVKWPLIISALLIMIPIRVYEGAKDFVHGEVHAVVIPLKEKRDLELLQLKGDIATIKQDTRDIKNHLLNSRRGN